MAIAIIGPKFYGFDPDTGKPLAGGKVYFYQSGTNIPLDTYTDETGETANPNPVILNAAGFASIALKGTYKVVLKDANDVEIYTADPVNSADVFVTEFIGKQPATYLTADGLSVPGNQTDLFTEGRAIKVVSGSTAVYGFIDSVNYNGASTVVTIESGEALSPGIETASVSVVSEKSFAGVSPKDAADFKKLRQDLAENTGAELIGTSTGETVEEALSRLNESGAEALLDEHNNDPEAHAALTQFISQQVNLAAIAAETAVSVPNIFETVDAGIQGTAQGEYFIVPTKDGNVYATLYKNVSVSGGTERSAQFAPSPGSPAVATKTFAADSFDDKYAASYSLSVPQNPNVAEPQTVIVYFQGKRAGASYTNISSKSYIVRQGEGIDSYPAQSISGEYLDAGENCEFRLLVETYALGGATLTAGDLTWTEGATAGGSEEIAVYPSKKAIDEALLAIQDATTATQEATTATEAAEAALLLEIANVQAALDSFESESNALVAGFNNDTQAALTDFSGESTLALTAFNDDGNNAINALSVVVAGSFADGATLTARNQVVYYQAGETHYRWDGEFPKTVSPGSSPIGTGGWVNVGQAELSSALANPQESGNRVARMAITADSLKDLVTAPKINDRQYQLSGFYAGVSADMGLLVWDASADKALHNLIDYIDPDRIAAWNGTQADLQTLKTAGTETGCFRRVYDGWINAEWAGITNSAADQSVSTAALFEAGNRNIFFKKTDLPIVTDRMVPENNTNIFLQPGVEFHAINGGSRVFQLQRKNINLKGYGAKTFMDGTQNSHNIYVLYPAENVFVSGLEVEGSGNSGDDCIYIGGNPSLSQLPKNINFKDIDAYGSVSRNIASVVACDGYVFEDCQLHGATQSIACGLDIEANVFLPDGTSAVRGGKIIRTKAFNNKIGFANIFGDDVDYIDCEAFDNANEGLASAAGGTQFDQGVARDGDLLGIQSFDTATGEISVRNTGQSLWDLGFEIGTVVQLNIRNSASYPAEINFNRGFISSISTDGLRIKISPSYDYGEITSFSGTGTGTLSFDPFASDLYMLVFREGQCSNIRVIRGNYYNNGTAGQIRLQTSVNVSSYGATVDCKNVASPGISASFCRNVDIHDSPKIQGNKAGTRGISAGTCSKVKTSLNKISGFILEGISVDGSHVECIDDVVENCGTTGNRSFRAQFGQNCKFSPRVFNDLNNPSNNGLIAELTVTNSLITGANCKGAGADNASSIVAPGAGNVIRDSIQRDGTFRP